MKYGLPYKGSKNKLAERIVDLLPEGEHLIDLFCGGCAVTHAALLRGKWPHIHINDIDWRPVRLFQDALAGRYNDERRWISREDFFRLRDSDPYVAIVWSFGNNMRDYLYSREIEPLKRAIHFAMFYADYEPARLLGHDLSFIDPIPNLQERYLAVKHYFQRLSPENGGEKCSGQLESAERRTRLVGTGGGLRRLGQQTDHDCNIGKPTDGCPIQKKKKQPWGNLQLRATARNATDCSTANVTARCRQWGGGEKSPLTASVGDYRDVEIPDGSVIYCDIPYLGTDAYSKTLGFDHEAFYQWCARQRQPLYVSSYQMPADRFVCIREFTHRSTLCATANNAVKERIFIPWHQARWRQGELFDNS